MLIQLWWHKAGDKGGDFMLNGYKTYIGAVVLFVAGGLLALGVITKEQFDALVTIGSSVVAVGFRSALKKIE